MTTDARNATSRQGSGARQITSGAAFYCRSRHKDSGRPYKRYQRGQYVARAMDSDCLYSRADRVPARIGRGSRLFAPAKSKALLGEASPEQYGTATGLLATARNPGMAVGIAMATLLYAQFGGTADSLAALRTGRAAFAVIAAVAILCGVEAYGVVCDSSVLGNRKSPESRSEGEIETCIYR